VEGPVRNHPSLSLLLLALLAGRAALAETLCPPVLDYYQRPLLGGEAVHLCDAFGGRVVLVLNTASKCGYTPQYDGLEALYAHYRERGLVVAGFPSNDFGGQEPGTEQQVSDFCRLTYGVRFPLFAKTRIRGPEPEPFYAHLMAVTGDTPQWNFHKYLIDRTGRVVASFPGHVRPDDARLIRAIEALL
jgi:glutathione peroxidase